MAETMPDDGPELIPTRKSLLSRLKNWGDGQSWREFFDTYWKLIYGVSLKSGLTHTEAQDVVQETVLGVAQRIGKFKYDPAACSFKTWLLTVARNRIANQFERRKRHAACMTIPPDSSSETPFLEKLPDPGGLELEAVWNDEWEKNLMDAALRRIKRKVSIEQYQMFDLYVLKNWPVREVARTLQVTVGHVYVAKHRLTRLLQKEIALLEKEGT